MVVISLIDFKLFSSLNSEYKNISNPRITIIESQIYISFSNTFSYDDREQSERRTWRKGQNDHVLYVDLTMNHKIDKQILKALKNKEDLAKFVDRSIRGEE